MIVNKFNWTVGYVKSLEDKPEEMYPAAVPGAVQMDYAAAKNWPSWNEGTNYKEYAWMEDVYWIYQTTLDFKLKEDQSATVVFKGIDYQYQIRIDGVVAAEDEGMFTPVILDVTRYAGKPHMLEVLLYPVPKANDSNDRNQARMCCKPAACYGWDWHPRLVSSGLYDDVNLLIQNKQHIVKVDAKYELGKAFDSCKLDISLLTSGNPKIDVKVMDGDEVAAQTAKSNCADHEELQLIINNPKLWYPAGYGEQNLYTLKVCVLDEDGKILDEKEEKIGFRRSRMVMNEGSWDEPRNFPKSRSDAPANLEINGRRIFAKGSNWVNAHIFPGAATDEVYKNLLDLVENANMNILRIWGGGFVNHDAFFDLCDEKGIMVWQEFPLACNEYPDDDHYLAVLEKEATSIVRRLRKHPCLVLWCGGNELFNNWSMMTDQHHALRLLDKVCYTEDRFTPYIMTSPLNGMAHGHYHNYDEKNKEEFITVLVNSNNTAYTEFGSPSAAAPEYIRQYISEADYDDCNAENDVWVAHHAFKAWWPGSWLRDVEADYYFGGYQDTDDLCHKTQFIQAMCYRSYFEEMRKQWPHCAMALNWCFNEPWPTFANNSLVSWPAVPKPGYYAVQQALRPALASLRVDKHMWWAGKMFNSEVWLLNDSLESLSDLDISVSYSLGEEEPVYWGTLHCAKLPEQTNVQCGAISFKLPEGKNQKIKITLKVSGHPEMDSEYTYLCRVKKEISTAGMLNV